MKKKTLQKFTAAVMAFALIGGAVTAGNMSVFSSIMTAKAETVEGEDFDHLDNFSPASFSEKTGVLLLNGKVNKQDVQQYKSNEKLEKISCAKGTVFPSDCSNMFNGFHVEKLDLTNAKTSNVQNMSYMFAGCDKLKSLDLSMIDTSSVLSMEFMFMGNSAESIDLSSFNTSNVYYMKNMFHNCQNLTSLDLSSFDTSKVKDMSSMFENCEKLSSLNVSSFNTSKAESMEYMFDDCKELVSLDVTSFDTSNTSNFHRMFSGCEKLTDIDVTGFDMSRADKSRVFGMLDGCTALKPDIYHISGQNISLDGSLGLSFYVWGNAYTNVSNPENGAKAVLSGPNGDVVISDLSSVKQPDGKYKFTYPVNATQAKEKVTLKIYDKNDRQLILCKLDGSSYYYTLSSFSQGENSVQNYINELKESSSFGNDAKLQILVNAIDNYCNAAENYFKGAENEVKEYKDEYAVTVAPFAPEFGEDVKISLVLDSATAVRIYTNASGVKIDGEDITPKTTKYGKCYEIANIPAHQLLSRHTLTIGDKNYQFSPMSYVYRTVKNQSASKLLKDTAWAAYLYANAANAYIK